MTDEAERDGLARARSLIALRRYDAALTAIGKVLARTPDSGEALCLRAQALIGLNRYREATTAAEQAVGRVPESSWPFRLLALAAIPLGDLLRAEDAADQAVKLQPNLAVCHIVRSQVASARSAHVVAVQSAEEARRLSPHSADAHHQVGLAHLRADNAEVAAVAFENAVRLDPTDANKLNSLGVAYSRLGRRKEALRCWVGATALDPTRTISVDNLKSRAALDLMPMPKRFSLHPLVLIPVAVGARVVGLYRWWEYRKLPRDVRRQIFTGPRRWYHFLVPLLLAVGGAVLIANDVQSGGSLRPDLIVGIVLVAVAVWWGAADWRAYSRFKQEVRARPSSSTTVDTSLFGGVSLSRLGLTAVVFILFFTVLLPSLLSPPQPPTLDNRFIRPPVTLPPDFTLPPGISLPPHFPAPATP